MNKRATTEITVSNTTAQDVYGTRQVQEYLLPILMEIDKLCRRNGIEYSLMGGGLLGAVRHKGFVPWDDDLDIIFDRQNYTRFLEIVKTQLSPEYTMIGSIWVKRITRKDNPRIDEEEGCIDLFVFDNVPENRLIAALKNLSLKTLQGMLKVKVHYDGFSLSKKAMIFVTHLMGKLLSKNTKLKLYDWVSQWGNGSPTRKVNNYVTYFHMISSMKYEADRIHSFIDAEFEGLRVRIFENYDHILTTQFGDYMTPPPMEKRVPTHIVPRM